MKRDYMQGIARGHTPSGQNSTTADFARNARPAVLPLCDGQRGAGAIPSCRKRSRRDLRRRSDWSARNTVFFAMQNPPAAPLISALNHVAVMTRDLDRFIDFYRGVLGLELLFREDTPALRHAILRSGAQSWLHPVEVPGNSYGAASDRMFDRGHLDHIALTAASPKAFAELRRRLLDCGASDGNIDDLGAFQTLWFSDTDGMRVEVTLIVDAALRGIRGPVPRGPGGTRDLAIERLTDAAQTRTVNELLRDYVPWVLDRLMAETGVQFDDLDEQIRVHDAAFAAETRQLLDGRGRLLLARLQGQPAGLVALKPVDARVAELKRLYVLPAARGQGIGAALLRRVLADAQTEGFHIVRLETLGFMHAARALYAAFGFTAVPVFEQSQSAMSGLTDITQFMALTLRPEGSDLESPLKPVHGA